MFSLFFWVPVFLLDCSAAAKLLMLIGLQNWSCGPAFKIWRTRTLFSFGKRYLSTDLPVKDRKIDERFFNFKNYNDPGHDRFVQDVPSLNDEIIISMSSGVDSSVTALMFAKKYPNVRGIFMANWSNDKFINSCSKASDDNSSNKCTVDEDWIQVRKTCKQLNIPCERVNFEKEYWTQVFDPMLNDYQNGLTPNPDIGCNKYVKFGKMIEHLNNKFNDKCNKNGNKWWLVTGHYAKILKDTKDNNKYKLFRANYKFKDQSYYLTSMPNNILDHILMPIGHYTKPEIRDIANDYDLITKDKPDSQGLCFVSQVGKFKDFLNEYIPPNPGKIVTKDGKVWGEHQGLWSATIGQKSGVSMPQGDPKYKGIWLVSDKNIEKNELIISHKNDRDAFYKNIIEVDLDSWYWMDPDMTFEKLNLQNNDLINCQIRSLQEPNIVEKIELNDGTDNFVSIKLKEKIFGIAPGQTLALYEGDMLLGSGVIKASKNSTS